jgi:uncharacterized protein (DUF58 family)
MNTETQAEIQEILRKVVSCAIPIGWQSNTVMPGGGERRSFYRGSGHEFDAFTEFELGDDPRDINWLATAQTGGQVFLKNVYREPRDIKIFVIVDVNPSMDFGTRRATKRRLAAELTASICKAAEETQDRLGYGCYSQSHVEKWVPTGAAKRRLLPALVHTLETPGKKRGKGSGLINTLKALPHNRSLVFILSDFLSLSDQEKLHLRRTALMHDVVCLTVQDKRERELPPVWGPFTLQDLKTGKRKTIFVTKRTREQFAKNFERHQRALEAFFKASHISWEVFSTEEGDAAIPKVIKLFATHSR